MIELFIISTSSSSSSSSSLKRFDNCNLWTDIGECWDLREGEWHFLGALTWTNFEVCADNFLDEACDKSRFLDEDWDKSEFATEDCDEFGFEAVDCDKGEFKDEDGNEVGFEVLDLVTCDLGTEDWEEELDVEDIDVDFGKISFSFGNLISWRGKIGRSSL